MVSAPMSVEMLLEYMRWCWFGELVRAWEEDQLDKVLSVDKETGQLSWFHKVRSWCDKSQLAALQTRVHAGAEETVGATAGIRTNCGDVTHMQFFGRSGMWTTER